MDALNRHHRSEGGVECRGAGADLDGGNNDDASYAGDNGATETSISGGTYFQNNAGAGSWGNNSYVA